MNHSPSPPPPHHHHHLTTSLTQVEGCQQYLIDPFNSGQICSRHVIEARLSANWGLPGPASISLGGEGQEGLDVLQPGLPLPVAAGPRDLLMRLLGNLRESYWGPLPASGRCVCVCVYVVCMLCVH